MKVIPFCCHYVGLVHLDQRWPSTSGIFKLCYLSVSSLFISVISSVSSASFYKLCTNEWFSNFQVWHMPQKFEFNFGSSRQARYLAQHIFAWLNSPQSVANQMLWIDFSTFNFRSYLIWLSYLISDRSNVWYYIQYYKVQGHTQYTCLTHGQHMHHCALWCSTTDTCI